MNLKNRGVLMSAIVLTLCVVVACSDIVGLRPATPSRTLVPGGTVVVYPGNMNGWAFQRGPDNTASCSQCAMVQGPGTPPTGTGSANMSTGMAGFPPSSGLTAALILREYKNTRLDQISDLRYASFRWPVASAPNPPAKLELVVDYDLTDQLIGVQGRIVYDPNVNGGFTVPDSAWQTWDARAGKWWGTQATVQKGGLNVSNPCVSSTPCTWTQLLAAFPNIGVHNTLGAVLFEAPPGSSFGVHSNVDNLVVGANGMTTTFDFELSGPRVPVIAPDSVPKVIWDSLISPSNLLTNAPSVSGTIIRDAVYVVFDPTATQATRQAAVDAVQGTVVGGAPLGPDNWYVVRIPYVVSAGDSTSGPALRAEALLRNRSGVKAAVLMDVLARSRNYRRPIDGIGFGSWGVNKDSASGLNWSLVAVNAPLAWGCETGTGTQTLAPIAVVDAGFYNVRDLDPNVGSVRQYLSDSDTAMAHGTAVASVLGAVGNNQQDIAGMLWKANLRLYNDALQAPNGVISGFRTTQYYAGEAAKAGARIVNISSSIDRVAFANPVGTRADSLLVLRSALDFMSEMDKSRPTPTADVNSLFVVGAGNDTLSAYFNGFSYLSRLSSYADNIITVGATVLNADGTQSLAPYSNRDSLVDVVAPGTGIAVLSHGSPVPITFKSGTSLSAPLVSGLAGMLLAFDSTLTAADLKRLIVQGAVAGGRTVVDPSHGSSRRIPIIDAYASMKLAALRAGGPLCGNRIWAVGGKVVVDRGGLLDTIATRSMPNGSSPIWPREGGRILDGAGSEPTLVWTASQGWHEVPTLGYSASEMSPQWLGMGANHDGDTVATVQWTPIYQSTAQTLTIAIADTLNWSNKTSVFQKAADWQTNIVAVAFHPFSGRFYLAYGDGSGGSTIESVAYVGGAHQVVATLPGETVYGMVFNSSGTEIQLHLGNLGFTWVQGQGYAGNCRLRFLNPSLTTQMRPDVPAQGACHIGPSTDFSNLGNSGPAAFRGRSLPSIRP